MTPGQISRAKRNKDIAAACRRKTASEVAADFGLNIQTVRVAAKRYGVKLLYAPVNRPHVNSFDALAMLINTPQALSTIAKKYGCARQYIYQIKDLAVAAGIKLHPRRNGK